MKGELGAEFDPLIFAESIGGKRPIGYPTSTP
jgi:hypothetical protein